MALRNLRQFGDSILKKPSKPVRSVDGKVLTLLDDMRDTLEKHNGLGLAAPQVGVLKRVAIVDVSPGEEGDGKADPRASGFYELINPEIVETEGEQKGGEGCLSLPGKTGIVARPERVVVRATNRDGEEYTAEAVGVLAVAFCHEIDHLDGILYTDKMEGDFESDDDDDEEEDE